MQFSPRVTVEVGGGGLSSDYTARVPNSKSNKINCSIPASVPTMAGYETKTGPRNSQSSFGNRKLFEQKCR
jgi:hypothetical protein